MPTADELRARSEAHQELLDMKVSYLTVGDLAKRWRCSESSVRNIPRTELPYKNVGTGLVRERRRYHPDDVYAYDAADRLKKAG